jgi:hypothetical protein
MKKELLGEAEKINKGNKADLDGNLEISNIEMESLSLKKVLNHIQAISFNHDKYDNINATRGKQVTNVITSRLEYMLATDPDATSDIYELIRNNMLPDPEDLNEIINKGFKNFNITKVDSDTGNIVHDVEELKVHLKPLGEYNNLIKVAEENEEVEVDAINIIAIILLKQPVPEGLMNKVVDALELEEDKLRLSGELQKHNSDIKIEYTSLSDTSGDKMINSFNAIVGVDQLGKSIKNESERSRVISLEARFNNKTREGVFADTKVERMCLLILKLKSHISLLT